MYNFLCFVASYAVLLQNLSFMQFTLFCREICFVAIYALWRGEKLSQKFCLWRKKDKYQVCAQTEVTLFKKGLPLFPEMHFPYRSQMG